MKEIKTLIIPDVHGREFWKEPVRDILDNYPDSNIVFLGDYHDPYGYEGVDKDKSLENFKEIVGLKKEHPDRIHLLIGNHDCSYISSIGLCNCRHDHVRDKAFRDIYWENHELFEIVHRDNKILYSHAGIIPSWVWEHGYLWTRREGVSPDIFLNQEFQKSFDDNSTGFWSALSAVGYVRGGLDSAGSVVWGDMSEHIRDPFEDYVQIFGHTQQEELPVHYLDRYIDKDGNDVVNEFYNLDCRQAFYLDKENQVRFYNTDEPIEAKSSLFNAWKWK